MRLWIDVEDIFQYAKHSKRLSGIQRVVFELQNALFELSPNNVAFVRHDITGKSFTIVSPSELDIIFNKLSKPVDLVQLQSIKDIAPSSPRVSLGRRIGRLVLASLPLEVANQLRHFRAHQIEALRSLRNAAKVGYRYIIRGVDKKSSPLTTGINQKGEKRPEFFDSRTVQGDWLISLGSPWNVEGYASMVQSTCTRNGLNFAILLYDIIPLRRPEWCDHNLVNSFNNWFSSVVPLADRVIAISHTTARDAEKYASETGMKLKSRIATIPLGTGLGRSTAALRTERLPPRGSFVLFVSTIEARKNHVLAFRLWRELLASMSREQVPTLVFAGRVGWLVADLMQQLKNADWLGGKILLIEEPSDGELTALYEDCLFTIYPSLFEGWGLPVTESLAHGTPCLAANASSLPEAGGALVRYFDPDNLHDALRTVRELLDNRAGLAAWRTEIRENFRPISWSESGAAILRLIRGDLPPVASSSGLDRSFH